MKRPQQQSNNMQRRQLLAQARKRVKHPQESDTVRTPTQQQQQTEIQQRRQLPEKKRQQARKKRMKNMKKSWPTVEKEKRSKNTTRSACKVSKKIKKCSIRVQKSERQQKILEQMKGTKNIANIKSAKRRMLIPKIKNMKGEVVTSKKDIADVFGEFHGKLYDDDCGNIVRTEADDNGKKNEEAQAEGDESLEKFQSSQKKRCKQPLIVSNVANQGKQQRNQS